MGGVMLSERELQRLGDELVTRDVRCCLSQLVSRFECDEEWQVGLSAAVEDSLRTEVELRTAELEAGAEPEDDGETRPAGADDPSDSEPRPPGSTAPTPPRTPAGPGDTPVVPPF